MLQFNYNDGGRSKYFTAKNVGDCGVRALSIASGRDYKECYDLLRKISGESPRNGLARKYFAKAAQQLGAVWCPTMKIGAGCTTHLREREIPMHGRIVCNVSRHYVAVIDGVTNDTYDCGRDGNRCVYGYWLFRGKTNQSATRQHINVAGHSLYLYEMSLDGKPVGYDVVDNADWCKFDRYYYVTEGEAMVKLHELYTTYKNA